MTDPTLLNGKNVLITGATGSLGKTLLRRILSGEAGQVARIVALSRDEAKQHEIRVEYQKKRSATDEIIYRNFTERLTFRIGDVRDFASVCAALQGIDIVFNAAALKQVPTCEYFPFEAVQTNVSGAQNIVRAIRDLKLPIEAVVGISTDKAVKPVNVMGMTKALQERILIRANLEVPQTRFVVVRYGNVLASRGSVIPLFHEQIKSGGPVTITDPRMTRFLLSLDDAVDLVFAAVREARRGEIYVPRVPGARVIEVAKALIGGRAIEMVTTGVRPGEKLHEILISEEEAHRVSRRGSYYVIGPLLPELQPEPIAKTVIQGEYSSDHDLLSPEGVIQLLRRHLMLEDDPLMEGEMLA